MPRVDDEKLASSRVSESSEVVRQRVLPACARQLARFDGSRLACNVDTPALPQKTGLRAPQAFHRVLKLAYTIADLAGTEQI